MTHSFETQCLTTFCENDTEATELFCSGCAIDRSENPENPMKKETILAILWEGNQEIPEEFIPREWFLKFEDVLDLCFIIDLGWVYATAGAKVLIDYCWEILCLHRGLNPDDEFEDIEDFMRRQSVMFSEAKVVTSEKKEHQNKTKVNNKIESKCEFCMSIIDVNESFCSSCRTLLYDSLTSQNTTKILYQFAGWNEGEVFDLHDGGDWDLGGKEAILSSIWESYQESPTEELMPHEWFMKFANVLDLCSIINRGWAYAAESGSEIIDACWEILCFQHGLEPGDGFENLESFMSATGI